jgi:hypothetical protein
MKKLYLILIALLCIGMLACQGPKEPVQTDAPTGEAVQPLPDDNGDGVPDVPGECAAVVYLSINPEIALFIDGEEKVVGVEFLNDDAREAYGDLKLGGLSYSDCTEKIIETAIEKQYLKPDGKVAVEVSVLSEGLESAKISQAVEEKVQEVASKQEMTVSVDASDVKEPGRILCWDCLGSGKCKYCETCGPCEVCGGKGALICEFCTEGYNECSICHGTTATEQFITVKVVEDVEYCGVCGHKRSETDVLCPTCKGSGRMPCHMCHGAGDLVCTACHGAAPEPCPFGGVGCHAPGCDGKVHNCLTCKGTGRNDCNECEDGTEPCPVICPHPAPSQYTKTEEVEKEIDNPDFCVPCNGQGRLLCNTCHGNYSTPCDACGETGITPCGMCPTEKGVCEMCHGKGMIDP